MPTLAIAHAAVLGKTGKFVLFLINHHENKNLSKNCGHVP